MSNKQIRGYSETAKGAEEINESSYSFTHLPY